MRMTALFALAVTLLAISGCAQLTTYNKTIDVEDRSVAIDAKQRVVYSKFRVSTDEKGVPRTASTIFGTTRNVGSRVICAEPSPDALAALAASNALSVNHPTGISGTASSGLAETAAAIGLRTQSIQLLRDSSYRICEAYANNAIDGQDLAALTRRAQSAMMGLIAIEQLTGPVVAQQVALSTAMGANTGRVSAVDLSAAKDGLVHRKDELDDAEKARTESHAANVQNLEKVQRLQADRAKAVKDDDQGQIAELDAQLKTAQELQAQSAKDLDEKESAAKIAKERLSSAESIVARLGDGVTGASAFTSTDFVAISKNNVTTTENLVSGVSNIVNQINASFFRDGCFSLLTDMVKNGDRYLKSLSPSFEATLHACDRFFQEDKDFFKAANQSGCPSDKCAAQAEVRQRTERDH